MNLTQILIFHVSKGGKMLVCEIALAFYLLYLEFQNTAELFLVASLLSIIHMETASLLLWSCHISSSHLKESTEKT